MSKLLSESKVSVFAWLLIVLSLKPYRFQRKQYANIEIVLTEKKGYGLRAEEDLPKCVHDSSASLSSLLTLFSIV